jgi:hypothetical protein
MAKPVPKARVHVDSYYVDPETTALCMAAEEGKGKIMLVRPNERVVRRSYGYLTAGLVVAALLLGLLLGRFLIG